MNVIIKGNVLCKNQNLSNCIDPVTGTADYSDDNRHNTQILKLKNQKI